LGKVSSFDKHKDLIISIFKECDLNKSATIRQLKREYSIDISHRSFNRALERWEVDPQVLLEELGYNYEIPEIIEDKRAINNRELWDAVEVIRQARRRTDPRQDEIEAKFWFDKPIGVCYLADLHIGNEGTEHDYILDAVELIADTEGAYATLNGDIIDNSILHRGSHHNEVVGPRIQKILATSLCESLFNKTLYVLQGSHEEWSKRADDFDFGEYLSNHSMGSYLGHGGDVYLKVKGAEYHLHVRHEYKYESTINIMNAFRQMFDHICPFDVGVISHMHNPPFIMHTSRWQGKHRKDVVYVRPGTAKLYDRWSRHKVGSFGAEFEVPVVIFMPEKKSYMPFKSLRNGLRTLTMLRDNW
jgi:hypothetical protein